jgi:hypothetical protein
MDFAFEDLIGKIIEIYLDDLTVFSKDRGSHVRHLRQVFKRWGRYGISLNPKKSIFGVDHRKLLGHIISRDGIQVDPVRVDAIKVPLPQTGRQFNHFSGKSILTEDSSQT